MSPEPNGDVSQWLKQLQVAPPEVDRDRLLYEAGRRSVKRGWAWPAVACVSLGLAALSVLTYLPTDPIVRERIVYVSAELAPLAQTKEVTSFVMKKEPLTYVAMMQDIMENKPIHSTANYSSMKLTAVPTAGSYLEWFPRER